MSSVTDTRYTNPKDENFPFVNKQVTWVSHKDTRPRHQAPKGYIYRAWSNLYKPTAECLRWDGIEDTGDVYAIGSRYGVFCYVRIEIRGRLERNIPGAGDARGVLARITFNLGSNHPDDIHTEECWVLERPSAF